MPSPAPLPTAPTASWDRSSAAHLLSRATFGATEAEVERFASLSREAAVDQLLADAGSAPAPKPPAWIKDPWVNPERRFTHTPREEWTKSHARANRQYRNEIADLRRWWLAEMLSTSAPLREVMTLFWHGHFATAIGKVLVSQPLYHQNETFRRHAVGNFRELLGAVTTDPAMLIYLDMEDSDRSQPNENYARELYELFTLGHGEYTERDIKETARALSGWTLAPPEGYVVEGETPPDTNRRFSRDGILPKFVAERHDNGAKTVLGRSGNLGIDEIVDLAVAHPACGTFLAGKLIEFFGCDDPSSRVREAMARAFRESGYEIAPMLRTLFLSPEFDAAASRGRQIKSPVQLVVGTCRQLGMEVLNTQTLAMLTAAMGQELFNPPNVKGWPGGQTWISTGTLAMRYHLPEILFDGVKPAGMEPIAGGRNRPFPITPELAARRAMMQRMETEEQEGEPTTLLPIGPKFDPNELYPVDLMTDVEALADALIQRMLVVEPRPALRPALVEAMSSVAGNRRTETGLRLLMLTPEYQLA